MSEMKKWPELVGKSGEEAKEEIEKDKSLEVQIVPNDCAVTMDFRMDRVRIFVDADNKVARPPMTG